MACINDDGTLTPVAKKVLYALRSPGKEAEIAELTGLPLYRVRSSLRELEGAHLLVQNGDLYSITEVGLDQLESIVN